LQECNKIESQINTINLIVFLIFHGLLIFKMETKMKNDLFLLLSFVSQFFGSLISGLHLFYFIKKDAKKNRD